MARDLFCLVPNEIVSDVPGADNSAYCSFTWPHKKGGGVLSGNSRTCVFTKYFPCSY